MDFGKCSMLEREVQGASRCILVVVHLCVYGVIAMAFDWELLALPIAGALIWASVVDIERFEIPDLAALLLAGLALVWLLVSDNALLPHLITGIGSGAFFFSFGAAYFRFRSVDGLGVGDAKLMVGIGMLAGPESVIWVILIAAISAIATLVVTRLVRPNPATDVTKEGIAFGPFLCLSAWGVWLFQGAGI